MRIRSGRWLGIRVRLFGVVLIILGVALAANNGQWQPLAVSLVGLLLFVVGYRKIRV